MRILIALLSLHVTALAQPAGWTLTKDISYASLTADSPSDYASDRCKLDVFGPGQGETELKPVLVWFHGGGLKSGEKKLPERLRKEGIVVVCPNYRLHPQVKSPVYVEDAAAAVAWAVSEP